jgi:hypothetical protein
MRKSSTHNTRSNKINSDPNYRGIRCELPDDFLRVIDEYKIVIWQN